jgi:hypothetical protein
VPRVKYAMDYRPKNSFSMSHASRKVIFPGEASSVKTRFTGIDQKVTLQVVVGLASQVALNPDSLVRKEYSILNAIYLHLLKLSW